jgi:hypothetical protein
MDRSVTDNNWFCWYCKVYFACIFLSIHNACVMCCFLVAYQGIYHLESNKSIKNLLSLINTCSDAVNDNYIQQKQCRVLWFDIV